MLGFSLLDIILLLALLFYLIAGLRNGLVVTLGGIVGFVAGAVAAFFAIPLVTEWVPDDGWRLTAVIATIVVLVLGGHAVGAALGGSIRRWMNFPPLRFLDRLLGGAVNLAVSALVMSVLAFSVNTLGVPFLSQQITSSAPGKREDWAYSLRLSSTVQRKSTAPSRGTSAWAMCPPPKITTRPARGRGSM